MMMLRNLKKVLALSGFVKKSAKLSCEYGLTEIVREIAPLKLQ